MKLFTPLEDLTEFIKRIEHKEFDPRMAFVVLGRQGPTGKTYLTRKFNDNGYKAIEIFEDETPVCKEISYVLDENFYKDHNNCNNYYHIDEFNNVAIVILNQKLKEG